VLNIMDCLTIAVERSPQLRVPTPTEREVAAGAFQKLCGLPGHGGASLHFSDVRDLKTPSSLFESARFAALERRFAAAAAAGAAVCGILLTFDDTYCWSGQKMTTLRVRFTVDALDQWISVAAWADDCGDINSVLCAVMTPFLRQLRRGVEVRRRDGSKALVVGDLFAVLGDKFALLDLLGANKNRAVHCASQPRSPLWINGSRFNDADVHAQLSAPVEWRALLPLARLYQAIETAATPAARSEALRRFEQAGMKAQLDATSSASDEERRAAAAAAADQSLGPRERVRAAAVAARAPVLHQLFLYDPSNAAVIADGTMLLPNDPFHEHELGVVQHSGIRNYESELFLYFF
jgi:hypothetical protein